MSPRILAALVAATLLVFGGSIFFLQRPERQPSAATIVSPLPTAVPATPQRATNNPREGAIAAIEHARAGLSGAPLKDALIDAIATIAEVDPAAAVELAAGLATDEERIACLHESWPLWLKADRVAAEAWVQHSVSSFSHELIQSLVQDTAATDGELALTLTTRLPVGPRGTAVAVVFETWAAIDPATAANRARELVNSARDPREVADTGDREVAAINVCRAWSNRDPQNARNWALSLSDAPVRRAALETLFSTWAVADSASAAASASSLPENDPMRIRMIDRVIAQWSTTDAPAALAWVQTVKDAPAREAAATTLLSEVVRTQPAEAADWAFHLNPDPGAPLVGKVVAAWAAIDSKAAREWVAQLPAGVARDNYLRELPGNETK